MGRRVVGVVDSDSFVKWGASLLDTLPRDWDITLHVIYSRLTASRRQVEESTGRTRFARAEVRFLSVREFLADPEVGRADAVVVACRGPVAEVLLQALAGRGAARPVLVSGLPGISIPAKWKGIFYRALADLFVLHSHREVAAYRELAMEHGADTDFALATLPFMQTTGLRSLPAPPRDSIVFAAQAIVPREPEDRQHLAQRLCDTAREHPDLRVVIKVRALPGEEQTHPEAFPLPDLLPEDRPRNLVVEAGAMHTHLERAVGFATVSSTAVLEAAALGIPSILIDDFGVHAAVINEVFVGSGLLAPSEDLLSLGFRTVNAGWLADNYAHPAEDNTFEARLEALIAQRDRGPLPERIPARRSRGGVLRRAWDRRLALGRHDRSVLGLVALVVGWPIFAVRRARRVRLAERQQIEQARS